MLIQLSILPVSVGYRAGLVLLTQPSILLFSAEFRAGPLLRFCTCCLCKMVMVLDQSALVVHGCPSQLVRKKFFEINYMRALFKNMHGRYIFLLWEINVFLKF